MTQDNPPVEVTQLDREAASAAYYDCFETPPNALWMAKMENGGHDDDPVVQAFARHRLASQRPAVGDEVERVEQEEWLERRIYRGSDEYRTYLAARFPRCGGAPSPFDFDGHKWAYYVTSFDDIGEYDVIRRRVPKAAIAAMQPQAPATWAGDPDILPPGAEVTVLAIDATDPAVPARHACWVRFWPDGRDFPQYRSCDLCDVEFAADPAEFFVEAPATGDVGKLVDRLERSAFNWAATPGPYPQKLYREAAAKLTELQAEVERLKMTAPALSAPPNAS